MEAPSHAGPVAQDARIGALDVLRGFALLGILVINIQFFAMPDAASVNPTAYGDLQGANFHVWLGSRMLALQRFMTLFSMLFGAGIVLMAARAEARGESGRVLHHRRMAWLALIGLLHAHLLWAGDILFTYAVCGMLVYPLRRLPARRLLMIGATGIAIPSVFFWVLGASMPYWPDEFLAVVIAEGWQPTQATIDEFLTAYRGGWLEQAPLRSTTALGLETFGLLFYGPRVIGLMLVGMALFKLDVFSAERSRRFYYRDGAMLEPGPNRLAGLPWHRMTPVSRTAPILRIPPTEEVHHGDGEIGRMGSARMPGCAGGSTRCRSVRPARGAGRAGRRRRGDLQRRPPEQSAGHRADGRDALRA